MEAVPERTVPHSIPLYAFPERDRTATLRALNGEAALAQLVAQLSPSPDM
jgi:hypothetical protein